MKMEETFIEGLLICTPTIHSDERGWFCETFVSKNFNIDFVQDNHSKSMIKGTLRGLHLQISPMAQTKLVRCTRGVLLDVAVDLRPQSPTYKKWLSIELSETNHKQLFIPQGFAHGFVTLKDNTEIQYKVDNYYSKEHDRVIRYNDPELNIDWGFSGMITLSQKDEAAPLLKNTELVV